MEPVNGALKQPLQLALLEQVIELLPIGVWLADADGRILLGNERGRRIWAGARYVGIDQYGEYKGWWPDGRQIGVDEWPLARSVRHGETHLDKVMDIECFDGTRKTIRASSMPIRDGAGRIAGGLVTNEDITEQARAERELRLNKERFEIVARATTDVVWDWDIATNTLWWNDNFQVLFGHAPETIKPTIESWTDFIHPEDKPRIERDVREVLEGGAMQWSDEYRFRRADGTYAHVFDRGYVVRDAEGRAQRAIGAMMDITARKAAEQGLRESESRFRSLVELSSDWYWETDEDLRFREMTGGGKFGASPDAAPDTFAGRRRWELPGAEPLEGDWTAHRAVLERREPFRNFLMRRRLPNGSSRVLSVNGAPMFDGQGTFRGYRGTSSDVTHMHRVEAKLRRFRLAMDHSADLIGLIDLESMRYVDVNDPLCAALGYSREELLRMHPDELIPHSREDLRALYTRLTLGGDVPAIRSHYRCKDGTLLPYESRRHAVLSDGRWLIVSIARDIRAELAAEQALRRREEEFRAVAENAPDGIMRFDPELRCLYVNEALAKTAGHPVSFFIGRPLAQFGIPEDLTGALSAALRRALDTGDTQAIDFAFAGPRGERHYHARIAPERGRDGRPVSVIGISRDITERRRFEAHIQHLASHDKLTGLPNRALLGDRVEQAILQARRAHGSLALLFIDLDQFKLVNDSFGHAAGDALLVEVAERLKQTVREGDTVARLGGDEFVILLTNLAHAEDSAVVARKIAQALERPIALDSGELGVTGSIGISLYPEDGDSLDALLQCADAAMYRAKDAGRNAFHYYSAEMGEQARARVETEAGLRRAVEREELRLHFQPQVNLASGAITGVEALLRWQHPQRGMVSPAAFVPVAEESGLIVPIGQWALVQACRQAAEWSAAGLGEVKVAVNLSARQFWRGSVTESVRAALGESGLPPSRLELEITESVVMRDLQQVMLSLEQLRRMGVRVAIDDFGVGYSSLAYLRTMPISKLKIDKSFIHSIPGDPEATALVLEIVRLAHALSLEVVAEGVETPEQARTLREAGCEAMQGYLFARPLPPAECAALLRSGRRYRPQP